MAKHADRLKRIEKEVCADLECQPDDEICRHVSTLRLMRENMQAKLLVGERVAPDELLAVDAALKAYLPQGKPMTIAVQLVETLQGKCAHCGKMNVVPARQVSDVVRVNGERIDIAPASATSDGKPPAAADSAAPAAPTEPAKPIEPGVKGYLEGLSQSGFHSAVLNNGERAPLKKLARGYGPRSVVSPLSVDPDTAAPRRHNAPPQGSAFLDPNPSRKA